MVSQGSFLPVFTRPVALLLFLVIVWTVLSQFPMFKKFKDRLLAMILPARFRKSNLVKDAEQGE
jgi:putative tricarboxylic transport membrane protein